MERTKLKYRHFGTGEASHDNCMWRFVVKEFGGRDGKQIVCEDQTHFIRVSQVLRNLRADNTYEDMLAIMKTNVDHRSFQSVPSVQWHASLHKITSSQPKCDEWFQRKLKKTLVMFTMPLRNSSSRMLDQQSIEMIPTLMKLQVKYASRPTESSDLMASSSIAYALQKAAAEDKTLTLAAPIALNAIFLEGLQSGGIAHLMEPTIEASISAKLDDLLLKWMLMCFDKTTEIEDKVCTTFKEFRDAAHKHLLKYGTSLLMVKNAAAELTPKKLPPAPRMPAASTKPSSPSVQSSPRHLSDLDEDDLPSPSPTCSPSSSPMITAALDVGSTTRLLQFLNHEDFEDFKSMLVLQRCWAEMSGRASGPKVSLCVLVNDIISALDGFIEPCWVATIRHGLQQGHHNDYFEDSSKAEEFLKLRPRMLVALLSQWCTGSSRLTADDHKEALIFHSNDEMFEEAAACDVSEGMDDSGHRVLFWTAAMETLVTTPSMTQDAFAEWIGQYIESIQRDAEPAVIAPQPVPELSLPPAAGQLELDTAESDLLDEKEADAAPVDTAETSVSAELICI